MQAILCVTFLKLHQSSWEFFTQHNEPNVCYFIGVEVIEDAILDRHAPLRSVFTCNFCFDVRCDFLPLVDVNEWMHYECSNEGAYIQNNDNSSIRSHASKVENRTRIAPKIASENGLYCTNKLNGNSISWITTHVKILVRTKDYYKNKGDIHD